jgi:hypothetical protein
MGKLWDLPTLVNKPIGRLINIKPLLIGVAAVSLSSVAAQAGWVYDNLNTTSAVGDCSFSTTCAAELGRGDEFAAQLFTLSSTATIDEGAFSDLVFGSTASSVNYAIYADVDGLPGGTALESGSATLTTTSADPDLSSFLETFPIASITLSSGSYFFAVQAVTSNQSDFLQQGLVTSGAAETHDGGLTWSAGYENSSNGQELYGVSVALGSAVPEPSTWAMMLLGFAGLGYVGYRQRQKLAGAASV